MMVTLLGRRGVGHARGRPGGERRRRSIQLRRHGACAARRPLDPVRARDAHPPRPHHIQHHLGLGPRDDAAPPARHRGHRVRHRRASRPDRRRGHRRAPRGRRLALPGRSCWRAPARPGRSAPDYRIPDACRNNLPQRLEQALNAHRERGYFSDYPFGTDLTREEIALARALRYLDARTGSARARLATVAAAVFARTPARRHAAALSRMGLERPRGFEGMAQQRLVVMALEATGEPGRV